MQKKMKIHIEKRITLKNPRNNTKQILLIINEIKTPVGGHD